MTHTTEEMTMMTTQTQTATLTVWLPRIRQGAPSNAAGLRGAWTPYATKDAALRHEHWANQAPWADAMPVEIVDAPYSPWGDSPADLICTEIVDAAETYGDHLDATTRRAAFLIRGGRRVEGVSLVLAAEVA